MPTLPRRSEVDTWLGGHLGLTLDNFPDAKGERLLDHLADKDREVWDDEVENLWQILSIPETHFARHPECFEALRDALHRIARARPAGTVKLWSAGCASGEEAYQLAAEGLDIVGDRVQVTGTDFSEDAVARATKGVYNKWSMRGAAAHELDWLTTDDRGDVTVDAKLRPHVQFEVGNLTDPACAPKRVDVAFCRNVLIYFSTEGGERVLRNIIDSLRPGGVLILAPTDPTYAYLDTLETVELSASKPVRVYQAPGSALPEATPTARRREPEPDSPIGEDFASAIRKLLEKS